MGNIAEEKKVTFTSKLKDKILRNKQTQYVKKILKDLKKRFKRCYGLNRKFQH